MTTLNRTLTAPALAKALQLTAKNKTMQSGIKEPQNFSKQFEAKNSYCKVPTLFSFYCFTISPLGCILCIHYQLEGILIYLKGSETGMHVTLQDYRR